MAWPSFPLTPKIELCIWEGMGQKVSPFLGQCHHPQPHKEYPGKWRMSQHSFMQLPPHKKRKPYYRGGLWAIESLLKELCLNGNRARMEAPGLEQIFWHSRHRAQKSSLPNLHNQIQGLETASVCPHTIPASLWKTWVAAISQLLFFFFFLKVSSYSGC